MEDVDLKPILSKESLLSTLWSDGVLLNTTAVAPSPSKDFCQLLISDDETVIRSYTANANDLVKVTELLYSTALLCCSPRQKYSNSLQLGHSRSAIWDIYPCRCPRFTEQNRPKLRLKFWRSWVSLPRMEYIPNLAHLTPNPKFKTNPILNPNPKTLL